ncbi:F0F1 ATP synthase subunit A [Hahella aquimaris]|uniref:F0F1 ATP synthase subunit A n=1 Tax=Hahella sp. HNIBRBA332 TaxID=3015983 RepID=UPI00273B5618|nr:F0F1 ATP synthase subunit A [Hahella sp. HNIBRBA332]WLQ12326.1 F0F1 ATP synthase subunit A [Hahella sp. HNIBRBA332]
MNDGVSTPVWLQIGPLAIHETVVMTWLIMLVLVVASILMTRRLSLQPGRAQAMLEGVVLTLENAIASADSRNARRLLPLIGTFWIFLPVANLLGVIPGLHSPTRDLSVTAALALVVFCAVHAYGVRQSGLGYFKHYLSPSPILLPFHIISEITRTVALAIRLFGNIMSLEMAALLILLVAGFLAPVPILMLHIIEALVQAYIFGMLALIYVAGAMQQTTESPITTSSRSNSGAP